MKTLLFQSTHPRRVRQIILLLIRNTQKFQSTHPRRVRRPVAANQCISVVDFNPRTHEGCGSCCHSVFHNQGNFNPRTHEGCGFWLMLSCVIPLIISIHAPTKGAAKIRLIKHDFINISIHAPTKGAADYQDVYDWFGIISIHAPTKGAAINGVS